MMPVDVIAEIGAVLECRQAHVGETRIGWSPKNSDQERIALIPGALQRRRPTRVWEPVQRKERADDRGGVGGHDLLEQWHGDGEVADEKFRPHVENLLVVGRRRLGDVVAGVGEYAAGCPDGRGDLGVGLAAGGLGEHGDANVFAVCEIGQHCRHRAWISGAPTSERHETGADVGDAARHRPLAEHLLGGGELILRWDDRRHRHHADRRLDRCDAAAVGRIAQRAADVVAESDRAHTRCDRRCFATARPTGGRVRIPGIPGETVEGRVGVDAQPEVGHVRPRERDGARGPHSLDRRRVDRSHRLGECRHALRRRTSREVDVLLDRARHAMEYAELVAGCYRPVGRVRRDPRLVIEPPDDCVQMRIDRLDPFDVCLEYFAARRVAQLDLLREFECAQLPEFAHCSIMTQT